MADEAHGLSGAAGNLQAHEVHRIAREPELRGREARLAVADEPVALLSAAIDRTLAVMAGTYTDEAGR